MRIFELLHCRPLREDNTDLTDPISQTGVRVGPGAGSTAMSPPTTPQAHAPGFGPTAPGYSKDPAGNWTNPQGRPPDAILGSGSVRYPGWEIPMSAAEKATDKQNWHNAFDQYSTKGDMSGFDKLLDAPKPTAGASSFADPMAPATGGFSTVRSGNGGTSIPILKR